MWNSILEVLEEKARAGLDVRFIYDDFGCVSLLPAKYSRILEAKGIKSFAFNPFVPLCIPGHEQPGSPENHGH